MTRVHRIWELPKHNYPQLSLASSTQRAEEAETNCWYSQMNDQFQVHGMEKDLFPPSVWT